MALGPIGEGAKDAVPDLLQLISMDEFVVLRQFQQDKKRTVGAVNALIQALQKQNR